MKRKKILLFMTAAAIACALAGCGQASDSDASSAQTEGTEEASSETTDITSTVTFNKTYWAGDNIRVRMLFTEDGDCKYGYIGKYDMETSSDGYPIITFVYYADTDNNQIASYTYAFRDNGDGTYTKVGYSDGEEPDFDLGIVLTPDEGTDGVLGGELFDGVYTSSDGQYYTFGSDGTFAIETWLKYTADEKNIEITGSDSSTLYTYTASDDLSSLTLMKDGETVMELSAEDSEETEETDLSD